MYYSTSHALPPRLARILECMLPLYVDRHELEGVTAEDVAAFHPRDLDVQDGFGVRFVTSWYDSDAGHAFCLVDSPNREAVRRAHGEAHGAVPGRVIEADLRAVRQFPGPNPGPAGGRAGH